MVVMCTCWCGCGKMEGLEYDECYRRYFCESCREKGHHHENPAHLSEQIIIPTPFRIMNTDLKEPILN